MITLGGGLRPPSEPPPTNRLPRQSRRSNDASPTDAWLARAPVSGLAGLDVLVQLLAQVQSFQDELHGRGRGGRVGGAELPGGGLERGHASELLHVLLG